MTKRFIAFLAATLTLCACGTSNQSQESNPTPIVPKTDPVVIELDTFEGHTFGGDRAYITLCAGLIKGQIPTVAGMVRTGMMSSHYALSFDRTEAEISQPNVSKKGNSYSFNVIARDGQFFNSFVETDWRMYITVWADGRALVNIESDRISAVFRSRTWQFYGHVDPGKTEALELLKRQYQMPEF